MNSIINDSLNAGRTTWNALPAGLLEAAKFAFPNRRSPKSIPDEKWAQLMVAYGTWHYIFFSDKLIFRLLSDCSSEKMTDDKMTQYLIDIALRIAAED